MINDFIFICFLVGNDFLPHVPGIEIIEGGIDFMIDTYKKVCSSYGHLTRITKSGAEFRRSSLSVFLGTLSKYEYEILKKKAQKRSDFFYDELLEKNIILRSEIKLSDPNGDEMEFDFDIETYRKDYYEKYFPDCEDLQGLCHEYLEGMQWVLSYYTKGVSNWEWFYEHHYAPFVYDIARFTKSFSFPEGKETRPSPPYLQLMCILPPSSSNLIPTPLSTLMSSSTSEIAKYYDLNPEIDLAGKRNEWEAVVILPKINYKVIKEYYSKNISKVDPKERNRNKLGHNWKYIRAEKTFEYKSFYGNFICTYETENIKFDLE